MTYAPAVLGADPPAAVPLPAVFSGRTTRAVARAAVVVGLTAGLTLAGTGAADAHVHVVPDHTSAGSFSALTFRVPNESTKADTVKVTVHLPAKTPFVSVSGKSLPGWALTAEEQKLPQPVQYEGTTLTRAVQTVTWTARPGSETPPGQYQEFALSVGPLPAPGEVVLPVDQTYSDGTVVSWDEPTPASGAEPEHPAPSFTVTAAVAGDADGDEPAPSAVPAKPTADPLARGLGAAALVVSLAGLAVAFVGLRRRPARGPSV